MMLRPIASLLLFFETAALVLSACNAFTTTPVVVSSGRRLRRTSPCYYHAFQLSAGAAVSTGSMSNDPRVLGLLQEEAAKEQAERDTVERAKLEEQIMLNNNAPRDELLMATKAERQAARQAVAKALKQEQRLEKRTTAKKCGGGGFGGGSSSSNNKKKTTQPPTNVGTTAVLPAMPTFDPKMDRDGFGAVLQQEGVVRINQVVSKETTTKLRHYIDEELHRAQEDIASGKVLEPARFARVLLKRNRWDMSLPFDGEENGAGIVRQALWELLGDSSESPGSVGHVIESTLTAEAQLHELGSLISDPDSDRQIIHPDVPHQGERQKRTGPFVTCFVSVQDVDEEMGPTEFLPRTNTAEYHERLNDYSRRDEMLKHAPVRLSLLKEGDCSIYDTTTLHAGGANRSTKRRRIFYCTFRSLSMGDDRTSDEPGSIRPEVLKAKLSLNDIRQALHAWRMKEQ